MENDLQVSRTSGRLSNKHGVAFSLYITLLEKVN